MKASQLSVVALAAGALVVAGCGDDDEGSDRAATDETATEKAAKPGKASQTVRLSATDFKFDPKSPKVNEPGTVKFVTKNDGQAPHALEVEGPSGEAETETIQPGESAELTVKLDKAGTFTMYCPIGNHRQMGMEGRIAVAGGGTGGARSETETDEDSGGGSDDNSGSGGGGGY